MPNPTFLVPITRDVTETTYIRVESEMPETAVHAALAHARCCGHLLEWERDDCTNSEQEVYFAGDDDYSAVEEVGDA